MKRPVASTFRRWFKWPLIALGSLIGFLLAAITGTAVLVDAGYFHEPIRKLLSAKVHREIQVLGPVQTHLLSWHPSLTADHVVIHNPPWMPAGILADIRKLTLNLETPTLAEPLRFRRIELQSATINLLRDESGKANWRSTPGRQGRKGPPLMGSLSVPDAQVHLRDARRHLTFDGKVSTLGLGAQNLQIDATGQLNTRPMKLSIIADPLATARRDRPYAFRFEEQSSGSTVSGKGQLARPFDMRDLQATLEASGDDLKDLYFLAGVNFPDTGPYRVSGKMQRVGLQFAFTEVQAKSGESDISGTVYVDSTAERSQLTADMHSKRVRRADLGKRAAKRAPQRKKGQPLLPDSPLQLKNLRRNDWSFKYRASVVELGRLRLNTLAASVKLDHGVLTATPVTAKFADGSMTGRWIFDGSRDVVSTQIALDVDGLQLSQFGRRGADQPPLQGLLRARLQLAGKGRTVHDIATSADGTIVAILPQGKIRASLAELGGLDLRALGLKLSGKKEMTTLRCGVAAFEAHDGKLTAQAFVVDTEPVLIRGQGALDLASEALDFQFRGYPKHVRLRLRSSLVVGGTLAEPAVGLKAGSSIAQAGAGVALGVLLTPVAALAAFIDPGRAKDADCAALIATSGG